jgi:hypothetical protein
MSFAMRFCRLRTLRLCNDADRLAGVETDCVSKLKELHDVQTPLPAFDVSDKGLVATDQFGQFRLAKTAGFALLDKPSSQSLVPR